MNVKSRLWDEFIEHRTGAKLQIVQEYMDGSYIAEVEEGYLYHAYGPDDQPIGIWHDNIDEAAREIDPDMC